MLQPERAFSKPIMPTIGSKDIRFHRMDWMKSIPIFGKAKDRQEDNSAPTDATGTGAPVDPAQSEQEARRRRYYFWKMISSEPAARAGTTAPSGNTQTDAGNATSQSKTTLQRLREGASHFTEALKEGLTRLDTLFSASTSEASRKDSEAAIDFYLTRNKLNVPSEVQELLIQFDIVIKEVHQAFPYGRGNILVKNGESLAGYTGDKPNEFDKTESALKSGLGELARHIGAAGQTYPRSPQDDHIGYGLRLAASQILLGVANCSGYVDATASAFMSRLKNIRLPDPHIFRLNVVGDENAQLRLDDANIDHTILEAVYTAADGQTYRMIIDPWADMNTPILKDHSKYEFSRYAIPYIYDNPDLPYYETMKKDMNEVGGNLQSVLDSANFAHQLAGYDEWVSSADPNQEYPLEVDYTHGGFFTRESLNAVKEGVILPDRNGPGVPTRRASILSAQKNPIFANSD